MTGKLINILNEFLINTISKIVLTYDYEYNRKHLLSVLTYIGYQNQYNDNYDITQTIMSINECSKLLIKNNISNNKILNKFLSLRK